MPGLWSVDLNDALVPHSFSLCMYRPSLSFALYLLDVFSKDNIILHGSL